MNRLFRIGFILKFVIVHVKQEALPWSFLLSQFCIKLPPFFQDYIRSMRAANSPVPPLLDALVEQDEVMGYLCFSSSLKSGVQNFDSQRPVSLKGRGGNQWNNLSRDKCTCLSRTHCLKRHPSVIPETCRRKNLISIFLRLAFWTHAGKSSPGEFLEI